jgi:hypothetical protein
MALPKPDDETLVADFNGITTAGRILQDEVLIQKLKRSIRAHQDDYVVFNLYMASLYCLTGDYQSMKKHGDMAIVAADPYQLAYHATTLTNAGFFTEARSVTDKIDLQYIVQNSSKEEFEEGETSSANTYYLMVAALTTQSHHILASLNTDTPNYLVQDAILASDILRSKNIEEQDILSMLDVAGQVMRDHGLTRSNFMFVHTIPAHRAIKISIPINLPPSEMAELEWEFSNKLFELLPDAPYETIIIGFCCSQEY